MKRRKFLTCGAASTIATVSGCLGSDSCDESSNHLYIENQQSTEQKIDVRVFKQSDGIWSDSEWSNILLETFDIPSNTHRVVEEVYDEHGTYRTEAECQFDQGVRSEQQRSEVDNCDGQVVTIGIGENIVTILNGLPDHLASDNDFGVESTSFRS